MMSERQLLAELRKSGRPVTIAMLGNWKTLGLLPRLVRNRGSKRFTHSIPDPDAYARAIFVADAFQFYTRADTVIWALWLAGFYVQETRLKSLFRQRLSRTKMWNVLAERSLRAPHKSAKPVVRQENREHPPTDDQPEYAYGLIDLVFEPIRLPRQSPNTALFDFIRFILGAFDLPGYGNERIQLATNSRIAVTVDAILFAIESSSLVRGATIEEIDRARNYAAAVGRLHQICALLGKEVNRDDGRPPFWSVEQADAIGTPVLLIVLFLLRSGRETEISRSALAIDRLASCVRSESEHGGPTRAQYLPQKPAQAFCRRMTAIWRSAVNLT